MRPGRPEGVEVTMSQSAHTCECRAWQCAVRRGVLRTPLLQDSDIESASVAHVRRCTYAKPGRAHAHIQLERLRGWMMVDEPKVVSASCRPIKPVDGECLWLQHSSHALS